MNIALMSHDNKKELMVQFCTAYAGRCFLYLPAVRPEQHPLCQQSGHGGGAGTGSGPGRFGLALHRQSLQPSHRLTFFPKAHTITLLIHLHRADAAAVLQSPAPQRGAHR